MIDEEEKMNKKGGEYYLKAEDGIRDLVRSRRLGDKYKRQVHSIPY